MRKKILGIVLLASVVSLVVGTVAAYQGVPENTAQTTDSCMCGCGCYAHARYMHGQNGNHERGTPQFMGLGVKGHYLGEVEIDKE
ncbi:MAG TPA: hypothetical protein EYG76_05345, partial [Methanothermococcus okinawensis]|nr:hypothetical protein [Methanothermococcus okinawensis]